MTTFPDGSQRSMVSILDEFHGIDWVHRRRYAGAVLRAVPENTRQKLTQWVTRVKCEPNQFSDVLDIVFCLIVHVSLQQRSAPPAVADHIVATAENGRPVDHLLLLA